MRVLLAVTLLLFYFAAVVFGDCYLHNPRGSNDRLNEQDEDRDNADRLFDSQNNAAGGYCVGPSMHFYQGSQLSIEWTAQHGCNNPKMVCNMVLQFMCSKNTDDPTVRVRDGTSTTTITTATISTTDSSGNLEFGMHENGAYFTDCNTRSRNKGLFIADNNVNNNAQSTRQNNGGGTNGFECQEERDYYPYWHPAPWKDIAVLVDPSIQSKVCGLASSDSQNVKFKNYCQTTTGAPSQYNNEADCTSNGDNWLKQDSWGIGGPDCVVNEFQRDNHLGNTVGGLNPVYNWTVDAHGEPCVEDSTCACVLRIRYNISTDDYNSWGIGGPFVDSSYNGGNSPVYNNPTINVENGAATLTLALNTDQYGRTFQDRTHVFEIRKRPSGVDSLNRIYNLNVRGKRGNIVQTYDATEYDFVPETLVTHAGDYVHFQWTGCDTNPNGNAGEGKDGTDRSNIVQIESKSKNYPASDAWLSSNGKMFSSDSLANLMAHLGQTNCKTQDELIAEYGSLDNAEQDDQNCLKLNSPTAIYFNAGLIKMNNTGTYHYMSTRNNNFTNRGQKATLMVTPLLETWAIVLVSIGGAAFVGAGALGGLLFYANRNPHSALATSLNKITSKM